MGDIDWGSHAADRDRFGIGVEFFLRDVGVAFSDNPSGSDYVDGDAIGCEFGSHAVGPSFLSAFCGDVHTEVAYSGFEDFAANIDDSPPVFGFHVGQYRSSKTVHVYLAIGCGM